MKKSLQEEKRKFEEYKQDMNLLAIDYEQCKRKLQSTTDILQNKEHLNATLRKEKDELSRLTLKYQKDIAELTKTVSIYKTNISGSQKKLRELNEEIKELQAEIQDGEEQLDAYAIKTDKIIQDLKFDLIAEKLLRRYFESEDCLDLATEISEICPGSSVSINSDQNCASSSTINANTMLNSKKEDGNPQDAVKVESKRKRNKSRKANK